MISVLMPFYRHDAYVWEAIQSIMAQTVTDWELIILIDGPECTSLRHVETLGYGQIRLIQTNFHWGQTHQLNTGISLARGGYIAFQDADDVSFPWRFDRSLRKMTANVDLVYGDKVMMYPDREAYFQAPIWDPNRFHEQPMGCWGSYMIRTEVAKKVRFDENIGYWNDHIWEARLAAHGVNAARDPVPYYKQRMYSSNFRRWKIPVVRKFQRKHAQRKINKMVKGIVEEIK